MMNGDGGGEGGMLIDKLNDLIVLICDGCLEMVIILVGSFLMGFVDFEVNWFGNEGL